MSTDERLDKITRTLEYASTLQPSHDEQIARLVEQNQHNSDQIAVLTERTIQAMDAINRLARIVDSHEDRIEDLENPQS